MDDNLLRIFIAVTTFAVLIQAGILVALFLTLRKTTTKMEALAEEVKGKALPLMETVQTTVVELRPKIEAITAKVEVIAGRVEEISANVSESTTTVKNQINRLDATVTDTLDRARLQVIRADELLSRTIDKVEETSEVVQRTVTSPIRHVNGLVAAISTGVEVLMGHKRRHGKNGAGVPQDEMFI
jgi:methyl-accepting chemotaxis protein